MAADRAPVALCGEYAGLKFSERKYRAKDPTGRQPALWGGIFYGNFKMGPGLNLSSPCVLRNLVTYEGHNSLRRCNFR